MTHSLRNRTIRACLLLVLGLLLVGYSSIAPRLIVIASGILFVGFGLVSLLSLLRKDVARREAALYPVLGIATLALGAVLIAWPERIIDALCYLLAAIIMLVALVQMYSRLQMSRMGIDINLATYLLPLLTLGAALFVFLRPDLAAPVPFIILGAAYVLHALFELWSLFILHRWCKAHPATPALPDPEEVAEEVEESQENS